MVLRAKTALHLVKGMMTVLDELMLALTADAIPNAIPEAYQLLGSMVKVITLHPEGIPWIIQGPILVLVILVLRIASILK